jgi:methyl-accepting chemotaxis protein
VQSESNISKRAIEDVEKNMNKLNSNIEASSARMEELSGMSMDLCKTKSILISYSLF